MSVRSPMVLLGDWLTPALRLLMTDQGLLKPGGVEAMNFLTNELGNVYLNAFDSCSGLASCGWPKRVKARGHRCHVAESTV